MRVPFFRGLAAATAALSAGVLVFSVGNPVIALFAAGIALSATTTVLSWTPRRVEVRDDGVRVVHYLGSLSFPWEFLYAGSRPPRDPWTSMRAIPEDPRRSRAFWVDKRIAHAILSHPRCPIERFPSAYLEWADTAERAAQSRFS